MRTMKRVQDSRSIQSYIVRAQYMNGIGRLFGGSLLAWIDELAGIVARRHCGCEVITASIDHLNFKEGAYNNDIVVLVGRLTYVGKSSMEVRVDTYREDSQGMRHNINTAYFVMVAVDDNGKPIEVPGLITETLSEKALWESGEKRYHLRKQRRREGF